MSLLLYFQPKINLCRLPQFSLKLVWLQTFFLVVSFGFLFSVRLTTYRFFTVHSCQLSLEIKEIRLGYKAKDLHASINPILLTALTLKNYTAQNYFDENSSFLHTFLFPESEKSPSLKS